MSSQQAGFTHRAKRTLACAIAARLSFCTNSACSTDTMHRLTTAGAPRHCDRNPLMTSFALVGTKVRRLTSSTKIEQWQLDDVEWRQPK